MCAIWDHQISSLSPSLTSGLVCLSRLSASLVSRLVKSRGLESSLESSQGILVSAGPLPRFSSSDRGTECGCSGERGELNFLKMAVGVVSVCAFSFGPFIELGQLSQVQALIHRVNSPAMLRRKSAV